MGNNENLGKWMYIKHQLRWTENNIWVSREPMTVKDATSFEYKYVIVETGKETIFEGGSNRKLNAKRSMVMIDDWQN